MIRLDPRDLEDLIASIKDREWNPEDFEQECWPVTTSDERIDEWTRLLPELPDQQSIRSRFELRVWPGGTCDG